MSKIVKTPLEQRFYFTREFVKEQGLVGIINCLTKHLPKGIQKFVEGNEKRLMINITEKEKFMSISDYELQTWATNMLRTMRGGHLEDIPVKRGYLEALLEEYLSMWHEKQDEYLEYLATRKDNRNG